MTANDPKRIFSFNSSLPPPTPESMGAQSQGLGLGVRDQAHLNFLR